MAKKIEVTPEIRAQLRAEHYLENDTSVYNALNYETNSPLAKMIRRRALELGGTEWATREEWHKDMFCEGCKQADSPVCDKMMPCCKCSEKDCNTRQPCETKGWEKGAGKGSEQGRT